MSPSNTLYFTHSTFNPREQQKKSRFVAGLLLAVVMLLHLALALYIINAPPEAHKKPMVIMEVVLLPKPEPIAQVVKEPPPAPPPVKKAPVIKPKPVVKPPKPVIKKPAPKPKPKPLPEIREVIPVPKFEPAPPVAAAPAAPSTPRPPAKVSGHGQDDGKTVVSGVVALLRVPPKYPARAASRHIEGWVKIEFTVQTDGSVDDAAVVAAEPEGMFEDAALTAINKWKFKEKIVNGVAVQQRAVQKMQFKLEH